MTHCGYIGIGQIVARAANGVRQTYEYDKKGQLLAVKDADGNVVERYAYDKAGNMLKKTLRIGRGDSPSRPQYQTTTFAFDDANQLVSSTTDGVTTRYAYDAAGRLVKEGNKTYTYGYLDKVLSVSDGDTTRTFTYHADGQLASASCDGIGRAGAPRTPQTETFLWDGLALVRRGDEQFVNEPHIGGGNPVASSKGTSYFNDALGTTVGSKKDGKYSAAALTAFGENLSVDSPTPTQNSNFFTGKPYVEGLGHAFWMRNYRAGLAKWQTADPMGYPDGWNQLAYCGNGVTSSVDLWGAKTRTEVVTYTDYPIKQNRQEEWDDEWYFVEFFYKEDGSFWKKDKMNGSEFWDLYAMQFEVTYESNDTTLLSVALGALGGVVGAVVGGVPGAAVGGALGALGGSLFEFEGEVSAKYIGMTLYKQHVFEKRIEKFQETFLFE